VGLGLGGIMKIDRLVILAGTAAILVATAIGARAQTTFYTPNGSGGGTFITPGQPPSFYTPTPGGAVR
jgi:hypothetical protein